MTTNCLSEPHQGAGARKVELQLPALRVPPVSAADWRRRARGVLARAADGVVPSPADAQLLLAARGDELAELMDTAAALRDQGLKSAGRQGRITYSKKVFLPVTRLCRDKCHYCTFVATPGQLARAGTAPYMSLEEILEVAAAGAKLGCKEALFTLGDRPESRWPEARQWLADHGYASTLDYVAAMAGEVLKATGLLPHVNPGVMTWAEIQHLRRVAPSLGMMLETTSERLWTEKGRAHYGSPDKNPALRLRTLEDAGHSRVPFTTGVLVGIGESLKERADSLLAIRAAHDRHGHIQETIVQNFRAKPGTAMRAAADADLEEYLACVSVARLVMGPDATVQAPPNLTDPGELHRLVAAGIDDWGGVSPLTPDHVNPERAWPHIEVLGKLTAEAGYKLTERLTAHPEYVRDADVWIDKQLRPHVQALSVRASGLADTSSPITEISAANEVITPNIWLGGPAKSALRRAANQPHQLSDADYIALLGCFGRDLDELGRIADHHRHEAVGEELTYVVNRNIDSSLYEPDSLTADGHKAQRRRLDLETLRNLVNEASSLGATEICMQGAIHAHLPGDTYLKLVKTIRRQQPQLHIHAYRPAELRDGAARMGLSLTDFLGALRHAGLNSVPGTGAGILNDHLRAETDLSSTQWIETITSAHRAGLRSSATLVYGNNEGPIDQVHHLRKLAAIQDTTGGFNELILMPALHVIGVPMTTRTALLRKLVNQTFALQAVSRLLLHGRIPNLQAPWPKLGLELSQELLQRGANDLGGLLKDGVIWPEVGGEANRSIDLSDIFHIGHSLGRPVRQRTTNYGQPGHLAGM
jgi:FO synthase